MKWVSISPNVLSAHHRVYSPEPFRLVRAIVVEKDQKQIGNPAPNNPINENHTKHKKQKGKYNLDRMYLYALYMKNIIELVFYPSRDSQQVEM